jgi:hypothetical protein
MAEHYRAMAQYTTEDSLRAHYREIAEGYAKLADNEARIAQTQSNSAST